jgi:endonuclease/exonuclease/phosphatase family metal-dependent hydrolase
MPWLRTVVIAGLGLWLVLLVQGGLAPVRGGVLALLAILSPHGTLAVLVALAPLAAVELRRRAAGRDRRLVPAAWLLVLAVGIARFAPGMVPLTAPDVPADAPRLSLLSWNLYAGAPSDRTVLETLRGANVDLIGLQELRPAHAALIESDPVLGERYPHRILHPHGGTFGMGLLSRFPVLDAGRRDVPHTVWARVRPDASATVLVVNSHPLPAWMPTVGGLPVGFDPTGRDASMRRLRSELVDPALAAGDPVLLFGDFNVTDREPAYRELSAGLSDVQAAVGVGPGSTWRPGSVAWLPFGLIRIDHVFVSPGLAPVSVDADCTPRRSDHCIVRAEVAIPVGAGEG